MDGFERRKIQNREKIVNTALDLYAKYDLKKVSISDIARQARVSQVTIYNLFGSKDGLIEACIKSYVVKMTGIFRQIIKSEKPFLDKMEDTFSYFVEISESSVGLNDIRINEYPQFRELIERSTEQMFDLIVEFVREGQRTGDLNPDLSEDVIRAFIEVFIRGINSSPELHTRAHHDRKLFHDLLHLMIFGFSRVDNPVNSKKKSPK